jgi:hypothetical protein
MLKTLGLAIAIAAVAATSAPVHAMLATNGIHLGNGLTLSNGIKLPNGLRLSNGTEMGGLSLDGVVLPEAAR